MKPFKYFNKFIRAIRYNSIFPLAKIITLEGQVELMNGRFALRIPLELTEKDFVKSAKGTSEIEEGYLKVFIPDWLAEKIDVREGSIVVVDNQRGKFNIRPK